MPFTAAELEAMRLADEEIDAEPDYVSLQLVGSITDELEREARDASKTPQQKKAAEYQRRYNEEHKDEIKERQRRHYEKHKAEIKERKRRHYEENRAKNGPCVDLRRWRKEHGYTQKEAAQLLGVSQAAISLYESGAVSCNFTALINKAAANKKKSVRADFFIDPTGSIADSGNKEKMSSTVYHSGKELSRDDGELY